jgi:hypothetical protein
MAAPNYLVEAFKLKGNLIFVGAGLTLGLFSGSAVIWAGFVGLEGFYLGAMSTNDRFRRAVRSLRLRS